MFQNSDGQGGVTQEEWEALCKLWINTVLSGNFSFVSIELCFAIVSSLYFVDVYQAVVFRKRLDSTCSNTPTAVAGKGQKQTQKPKHLRNEDIVQI